MQRAGSADFDRKLANLQASSAQPGPAYAIMEWMSGHGLAARAWQWHTTLPVASRKMPEPLAAADVCIAQGDWESLRDLVHGEQWGDLEFLRLAYETRAYDEVSRHERGPDFHNRWQRTMISTGGSPNALSMLARVAQSWGWQDEAAQVWWLVAARPVGQRPALAALYAMASARKDTAELYRVAKRLLELEPASPVAKNNAAMFALLLRRDLPEAHKLAEEDYAAAPTEAPIASTYAFSLYLQGRVAEGVAVMARLPQTALSDASVAACDGVLLAAAGDREKARPLLEQAERNKQSLLPEERAMVEEALGKL
jgi:Flp pilus assembly protein TadD